MTHPVISLKPSYNSVIRGCPGLQETLPRIECELRIRSNDGKAFKIDKIEILLKSIESVNNLSHHSFGSKSKLERVTTYYKKNIKISEKRIVGIDIPLTIGLPDDIKETNFNTNFGKTVTILESNVWYNGSEEPKMFNTMVNVEKYTFLPTNKLYPSIKRKVYSPDKKFVVNYIVKNPCVTTDDILHLDIELKPNSKIPSEMLPKSPPSSSSSSSSTATSSIFNKKSKTKLKSVAVNLKEFLEVYDDGGSANANGGTETKENVLNEIVQPIDQMITNNGVKWGMKIRILTKNEFFREFQQTLQHPAYLYRTPQPSNTNIPTYISTKLLQNKITNNNCEIPFQYHTSITTTRGNLFRVLHGITIKFKINNGKSFQIGQPIDITSWTLPQLRYVEQLILQERETAKYARQFYENFGGLKVLHNKTEYPPLPPVVYPNDSETLKKLDIKYNHNTNNNTFTRIPLIE